MLEPFVRKHFTQLQGVYDRFPSPARNALASARGWILTRLRYSTATLELLEALRQHEERPFQEVVAHQLQQLQSAVDFALRTVPLYSRYPRRPIRSFDDLREFPVLDRKTLVAGPEQALSSAVPLRRRIFASTTGTTGTPLRIAYTEQVVRTNWAFLLRQWAWGGAGPREPRITLQGARTVPASRRRPPYWTYNAAERQILLSIFHLSQATAPAYVGFLERQQGKILEGFPSALGILADFVLTQKASIPMRVIFTSGEPLYPSLRTKIEAAFQAPVFDSYGMTEYCGLIQQCERGGMHLAPEYGFLEILDADGNPAGDGVEGDFAWTGFVNPAMPLIRYRIGDRGCWQAGSCPCGRASPLVVPSITREGDILRCPDGRLFSPRALNQLLKEHTSLRFCQFVRKSAGHVSVRAVPGDRGTFEELMAVRADLQRLLGPSLRVTAELAMEPLTRSGGKIPLIVDAIGTAGFEAGKFS